MSKSILEFNLSHSFADLGESFYSFVQATPFKSATRLVHSNHRAAALLDLQGEYAQASTFLDIVSGRKGFANTKPFAMLYAGHQFGHLLPQLGDGCAIIIAEVHNSKNQKWKLQLKGCGLTPFSREGDGRAVLRSSIREYLCSEAMHGLGIPTTQALCIVASDDEVYREQIEPGAIVTRMAQSHVRFGSFEVFYYRNQYDQVRKLADYVIDVHYPKLAQSSNRHARWLEEVIDRTASMIAQWQAVGFCHGVMNTDNMSVLGLTLDYGPFAFMDTFNPGYICNHSDHQGRYAFNQQPNVGLFNISCFAQAILPCLSEDVDAAVNIAKEKIECYQARYIQHYAVAMRHKLGLKKEIAKDEILVEDLLNLMAKDSVDYTILFRRLCDFSANENSKNEQIRNLFMHRELFDQWANQYRQRLSHENHSEQDRSSEMKRANPKYILRNYMAEIAIQQA